MRNTHARVKSRLMPWPTPGELPAVLDAARTDDVAFCVIDTRPSAGADAATAAALADLVLIPTRPAIFDLKAIGATVDIVAGTENPGLHRLEWHPRVTWFRGGGHHG